MAHVGFEGHALGDNGKQAFQLAAGGDTHLGILEDVCLQGLGHYLLETDVELPFL